MPIAVASAPRAHSLANAFRGRSRAVSEAGQPPPREPERPPVPKAASYTYFPRVKGLEHESHVVHLSQDDVESIQRAESTSDNLSRRSSPTSEDPPEEALQMPQLRSRNVLRPSRFLPFSSRSRDTSTDRKSSRSRSKSVSKAESPRGSPAPPQNKLRRRSWIVAQQQQPPSPTRDNDGHSIHETSKRKTPTSTVSIAEESETRDKVHEEAQPAPLSKKNKRLSGLFNATANVPPVPMIPKSFSTERLPFYPHAPSPISPTHAVPPLPRVASHDKLHGAKREPRKKDELWTAFRTLDGDLRKFNSKSMALKANVVRTALLPFLRQYASHPSNHKLRAEDLDRRVNILNGWWTALLELVAGRNNQSISGMDRPAILEGIATIMERPEWRQSPTLSTFADRAETSSSATSISNASSSSEFLIESVYHNVRNIFTQNLLSQMAFVVEKMSLRNAAASLVTFCGKTCAFAFCFCPSIADILVRLWNPSLEMMQRVLEEAGLSKRVRLDDISDRVVPSFPPMLHSLKLKSLPRLMQTLRQPASPPLAAANFDWYGLWMKRWSGAESDLFYVFAKHYHILVTDYLPMEPSNVERVCIPGLVIVHAQILVNLDATINRHATPQQPEDHGTTAAPITFDDVLEPDASASALAIPPANATRLVAENRLIMLVRDFLSERNSHLRVARRVFADSFGSLLQAQARKISIYDSNACYTLCDFLEEALTIMFRYEQTNSDHHSIIDWRFWLSVCRSMTESHNTATEIKLYSFIYTIWPTLCMDQQRKSILCLEFLLEPAFFESRFNHWCPMVRTYFMRLLCWRIARFDGVETDAELDIKRVLSDRLRSVWAHYLWLCEDAERKNSIPPSTQACNPAPGRRFLIIRNDNAISGNGPFLSFDGVVQNPHQKKIPPPVPASLPEIVDRPTTAMSVESLDFPDEEVGKGRWNILRNLIGGGSKQNVKAKATIPTSKDKENTSKTSQTLNDKPSTESLSSHQTSSSQPATPAPPPHRAYNFRFSLEWIDRRFGTYQNMRLQPPRLPLPAQILLQQKEINLEPVVPMQPTGPAATSSTYAGRALAEWTFVSHECQNFYDRRKNEGVPNNRLVETPSLAVEAFRRPG